MKIYALSLLGSLSALGLYSLAHQGRYSMSAGRALMGFFALLAALAAVGMYRNRGELFRRRRRLAVSWLCTLMLGYLAAGSAMFLLQDRLLFVPVPGRFAQCPEIGDEDTGKDFETVDAQVPQAGGSEQVRAYVQARKGARAWMILFHGNAESACSAVYYARQLAELPLNFAVVEYPGYRAEPGTSPSSQAAFQRNAEAAYSYVETRNPDHLPIISFGRSLGTGVATYLASVRPVRALVLISPYPSLSEVGAYQYPWLPVRWLLRNPFPARDWAAQVQAPVFIVHGDRDRVIPIALGRAQAAQFGARASFLEIPGADHGAVVRQGSASWDGIRAFLRRVLALPQV